MARQRSPLSGDAAVTTEDTRKPLMAKTDPAWHDHVMGLFLPGERDAEGHPTVDGLRRVVELTLGTIVDVTPHVVDTPKKDNEYRATAEVTVSLAWYGNPNDVRSFGDAADVYHGNTDAEFARFAVATAVTRAEGRVYRKILGLRKTVASEEKTTVPVSQAGIVRYATSDQVRALDKTTRDLNINTVAFIKGVRAELKDRPYGGPDTVPYESMLKILERANQHLRGVSPTPEEIKGYVKGWREGFTQ